jgi:hypothetical protein
MCLWLQAATSVGITVSPRFAPSLGKLGADHPRHRALDLIGNLLDILIIPHLQVREMVSLVERDSSTGHGATDLQALPATLQRLIRTSMQTILSMASRGNLRGGASGRRIEDLHHATITSDRFVALGRTQEPRSGREGVQPRGVLWTQGLWQPPR